METPALIAKFRVTFCGTFVLLFVCANFRAELMAQEQMVDQVRNVQVSNGEYGEFEINYESRFVLVHCDGTLVDPSEPWDDSTWFTFDPEVRNAILWLNNKSYVVGDSAGLALIRQAAQPHGFVFGDIYSIPLLPGFSYQEVLPGPPGCRGGSRTLDVRSINPVAGVQIEVTPNDRNGQGNGTTSFTRNYDGNATVTLTAPVMTGANTFLKWLRNGVYWAGTPRTSVTMNDDIIMTAVYENNTPQPCEDFVEGCPTPGPMSSMPVRQYCNMRIEATFVFPDSRPLYRAVYDVREIEIYSNFNFVRTISDWQRVTNDELLGHRVNPDFFRWLHGKVVAFRDDPRYGYDGNHFRFGEAMFGETVDGGQRTYSQVLKSDECDDAAFLASQHAKVPSGFHSIRHGYSSGYSWHGSTYPGTIFPALSLSFQWGIGQPEPKPKVDLLCASFEADPFWSGPEVWEQGKWTAPTWIVTEGTDFQGANGEVQMNIAPSMIGLSDDFFATGLSDSDPSMTPLKLISVERFEDAHYPFLRLTYETDVSASFRMIRPAINGQSGRDYTFVAKHKCHLIYEFPDDIFWEDGEWFSSVGQGSIEEFLCLNPLKPVIPTGLPYSGTFRFKVADAPGFVNWLLSSSTNGDPAEVSNALERLRNIFGHAHKVVSGLGHGNSPWTAPGFLPGEGHALVSVHGPPGVFPGEPPDILFQLGPLYPYRHLNYITGRCNPAMAADERRKDREELLSGFDRLNFRGESQFHLTFLGLSPLFPRIQWQETSVTVKPGERAFLHGTVEPKYLPSIQWYRGSSGNTENPIVDVPGMPDRDYHGTNQWLTTAPIETTTHYWFQVTNIYGFTNSQTIEVLVSTDPDAGKPTLGASLGQISLEDGGELTLNAPTSGSYPLSFQWLRDGVILSGETNAVLQVTNLNANHAGLFSVIVSNQHGSVTGQVAVVAVKMPVAAPRIESSPTAQTVSAGASATFAVTAVGNPLNFQWLKDGAILTNATDGTLNLSNIGTMDAGIYSVIAYNEMGSAASQPASLTVLPDGGGAGSVDPSFDAGTSINGGISAIAIQSDGRVLIAGDFTSVHGVVRGRIARLNADLSTDHSFNPGFGADSWIEAIAVQEDGKVVIVGDFTNVGGTPRPRIARLNLDGSLDASFNPGSGADGLIKAVAVQADGKIVVGGEFGIIHGAPYSHIGRLHADGSLDTSFNPSSGADSWISAVGIQPDGKLVIGGNFTFFNGVARNAIARLNTNGSLDTTFVPGSGASDEVSALAVQADGKIMVGGWFTSVNGVARNRIARMAGNGSLDMSFNPGSGVIDPEAGGAVSCLAVQPDGSVVVGGWFTHVNGTARTNIARLDANGNLDATFNAGSGADDEVGAVAVQADGKVIVGGWFTRVDGTARKYIARLNAVGTLDTSFHPDTGANNLVNALAVQVDGKVVIGGDFTGIQNTIRNRIARLNADGSLDVSFNPASGPDRSVATLSVQEDGRIVVGGSFTTFNRTARNGIARVNVDGTLDASFNPGSGPDPWVEALSIQADGKIVIGGGFTTFNGTARNRIARVNVDGTLDASFNPGSGPDDWVEALVLQVDGKVVIGGGFRTVNGIARNRIARLNADGSLDTGFNPGSGADSRVNALAVQPNGRIVIGGAFSSVNGIARNRIARLNSDGTVDTSFNPGSGADSWVNALALQKDEKLLVGGGFQNFNGTAHNYIVRLESDGGVDTNFNAGYGPDNWVEALAVQANGRILLAGDFGSVDKYSRRAVARLLGDQDIPLQVSPPQSVTVVAGQTAQFSVTATGTGPFGYQWRKNGGALSNGGNISGADTATLTLANAQTVDAGNYDVVVTNAADSVTSQVATLTVQAPPSITALPQSRTNIVGTPATFSVVATGTAPLSYQWRKGGAALINSGNISGADTATLTLASVQSGDAGTYDVVVSNAVGNITSQPAILAVSNPGPGNLRDGLLLYLPLNGDLKDYSGHGRDGTAPQSRWAADRLGNANSAFEIVPDSPISVVNLDPDNYAEFSFGCWVLSANGTGVIIGWEHSDSWGGTGIVLAPWWEWQMGSGSPSTRYYGLANTFAGRMSQNAWHHFFITHDSQWNRLYLDGELIRQEPSLPLRNNISTLKLGYFGMAGSFDEVIVYERALSAGEVAQVFTGGLAPSPTILSESVVRQPGGAFQFTVQTEPNLLPVIEVTADFITWVVISLPHTPPDETGLVTFTESYVADPALRFYRARLP